MASWPDGLPDINIHACNAVTLVWGLLRLAPIIVIALNLRIGYKSDRCFGTS